MGAEDVLINTFKSCGCYIDASTVSAALIAMREFAAQFDLTDQLKEAKKEMQECRKALQDIESHDRSTNTLTDEECLIVIFDIAKSTLDKLKNKYYE